MFRTSRKLVFLLAAWCLISSVSIPVNAVLVGDPANDILVVNAYEKGNFFPGIDITLVYTFGSTVVIQCNAPIPLDPSHRIEFKVLFATNIITVGWEAAIIFSSENNISKVSWIIGDPDPSQSTPLDWEEDYTNSRFLINETQLFLFFSEYDAVHKAELAVVATAEVQSETFKDWVPDSNQPPFIRPPPEDNSSTPTTPSSTPSTTSTTSTTVPQVNPIDPIAVFVAIPIIIWFRKRSNKE